MKEVIDHKLIATVKAESGDGLALVTDAGNNPDMFISHPPRRRRRSIKWRQYASSVQLQFVHEYVIHRVKRHQVTKLLGDDALHTIHADDRKWTAENWTPRAHAAGLTVVASKKPLTHFGRVSIAAVPSRIGNAPAIRAFDGLAEAQKWRAKQP